jgi:hypothetical protein
LHSNIASSHGQTPKRRPLGAVDQFDSSLIVGSALPTPLWVRDADLILDGAERRTECKLIFKLRTAATVLGS